MSSLGFWACACPHKVTLLASSFGAKVSPTLMWEFDFDLGFHKEVSFVHVIWQLF
jgi:hypothetical protein